MPFTDTQTKALEAKLSGKHVRQRQEGEVVLSYVEGWHIISEANRIFGFDAWDRETTETQCAWEGVSRGLKASSYVARVRVRVRAGDTVIVREGSGAGHGTGQTLGEAHERAIKQAETDATKRALATFGNPFGLALYDKKQRGVRRLGRAAHRAEKVGPSNGPCSHRSASPSLGLMIRSSSAAPSAARSRTLSTAISPMRSGRATRAR